MRVEAHHRALGAQGVGRVEHDRFAINAHGAAIGEVEGVDGGVGRQASPIVRRVTTPAVVDEPGPTCPSAMTPRALHIGAIVPAEWRGREVELVAFALEPGIAGPPRYALPSRSELTPLRVAEALAATGGNVS